MNGSVKKIVIAAILIFSLSWEISAAAIDSKYGN